MGKLTEYHRNYYHMRRRKMLRYVGGVDPKCAHCGSREELQFDHIDPALKTRHISSNMTLSNPEVRAELDKCQLLCEPCHIVKTNQDKAPFTHGTMYGWMKKKCACDACFTAKREWYEVRNAARRQQTRQAA